METETWLPIEWFEGLYEVSDTGRVRSVFRHIKGNKWLHGKLLKPILFNNGYTVVTLYKDRHPHQITIHRLVAETFFGKRSDWHVM